MSNSNDTAVAEELSRLPPCPPVDLRWIDLRYSVKQHEILKGLNGHLPAGQSLAVIGTSGAGKTTFLDIVAGRVRRSAYRGRVLKNGSETQIPLNSPLLAYVPQDDSLFAVLTVRECLLYSALLRLPPSMSYADKKARVQRVLNLLSLRAAEHTRVGSPDSRGASGGERRRTAIGMELVLSPSVLFLDEPTSGLDASNALRVAHIVRELCAQGRTVVATLHQPSAAILDCFTQLLVLSEGECVYYGAVSRVREYFASINYPMPPTANPADFVLELLSKTQLQTLVNAYKATPPSAVGLDEEDLNSAEPQQQSQQHRSQRFDGTGAAAAGGKDVPVSDAARNVQMERPGFWTQLLVLTCRSALVTVRTPAVFYGRVMIFAINALILATLFWRVGHGKSITNARDIEGFVVFSIALCVFTSIQALGLFLDEREIYRRERGSGYYALEPFVLSSLLVQLPVLALLAIIYSSISYFVVDLVIEPASFFYFVAVLFCTLFCAQQIILMISAIAPNFTAAIAIAPAVFSLFFLFSGFFISPHNIPGYWVWLYWLSVFHYALQGALENQFLSPKAGSYNVCVGQAAGAAVATTANNSCYISGNALVNYLGIQHGIDKWVLLAILIGFGCLYRFIFYLVLRFRVTPQRK